MENWKQIKEYQNYEVSDSGEVRKFGGIKNLKKSLSTNGYHKVRLFKDGIGKTRTIHKLVAETFLTKQDGLVINHIDKDKTNNSINNLEYITQRENTHHSRKGGDYSSKEIGVSWYKRNKKYGANIFKNGKNTFLGLFKTEKEASEAYQNCLLTLNN